MAYVSTFRFNIGIASEIQVVAVNAVPAFCMLEREEGSVGEAVR